MSHLRLHDREVDLERGLVRGPGHRERVLTTRARELLVYLVERSGETIDRADLLRDVWGYREAVVTRAVDAAVARLRGAIEADPARPRHVLTEHGVGYRFVADAPSAPVAWAGRRDVRDRLIRALGDGARLISLVGPPGVGKSHLARAALPDALRCELAGATDREDILARIARALELRSDSAETVFQGLCRQPSVVLDNAESVVGALSGLAADWLARPEAPTLVVTSRSRLGLVRERCLEVAPLPPRQAAELFVERARAAGVALTIDAVEPLVGRLDGLPLTIELVAARVRLFGLAALREAAEGLLDLATAAPRDHGARHRSLRAAIEGSWALLGDEDRRALARLAQLTGPFDAGAAQSLLGPGSLDRLQVLRDHSLVAPHDDRLVVLGAIRAFAREHADAADRARFVTWCVERSEPLADAARRGAVGARERLMAAWPDLARAADLAEADGEPGVAATLLARLGPVMLAQGHLPESLRLVERAVDLAGRAGEPDGEAVALTLRGRLRRLVGHLDAAAEDLERAAVRAASRPVREWARLGCALLLIDQGGFGEAEQALASLVDGPDDLLRARARLHLAEVRCYRGRFLEAREPSARAMAAFERMDARAHLATACAVRAEIADREGLDDECVAWMRRALAHHRAVGNRRGEAVTLANLSNDLADRGDLAGAEACVEGALALHRSLGSRRSEGIVLGNFAGILLEHGDYHRIVDLGTRAVALHLEVGNRRFEALTRLTLGAAEFALGDAAAARSILGRARDGFVDIGHRVGAALAEGHLAMLWASRLDDLERAEAALASARAHIGACDAPEVIRACIELMAGFVDLGRGDPTAARARLRAVDGLDIEKLAARSTEVRTVRGWLRRACNEM